MIFEKIENTKFYSKPLMLSDAKPLIFGTIPDSEMAQFTLDLALKITCDKNGKLIPEDKLSVGDFINIQKHVVKIMNDLIQKKS